MSELQPARTLGIRELAIGALFAATTLVSAFLLFQVQPLLSKCILPWFGGSPAVWTTCMLFFQVMLFGGYLYAHLLIRFVSPRWQPVVHLTLIALAIGLTFPTIAPSASWKPNDSRFPTVIILELLAATVALPYFVLSTTGPLVQAWFARIWPSRSPYRLYALSNAGSLAALLSYPFMFEPAFRSDTQAALWTWAFGLFAVLCGASAVCVFRSPAVRKAAIDPLMGDDDSQDAVVRKPTASLRLLWIGLPACASLMLLATTNFVCQDVAVIPFLWVVPLSLYLLTFIVCFDHPRWFRPQGMSLIAIALLVLSTGAAHWIARAVNFQLNFVHYLLLYFGAMFMACMVCHGQVVRLRPEPKYLTEYYLLISLGGAIGGILVGVVAPLVFVTHFEWTIALAASLVVAAYVWLQTARWKIHWPARFDAKGGATVVAGLATYLSIPVVCSGLYWITGDTDDAEGAIYRNRSFYGTVSVWEMNRDNPSMKYRSFVSGSIPHGRQFVAPEKRRSAISYFAEHTGIGRTLKFVQKKPNVRIGVVGMGVGVVATYARPGDYFRFYEINEQVADIAREQFTYLKDCQGKHDVILADARLALEHELADGNPQHFDVLMLDAFSGDAVPAHLLTEEAFAIYLQHLQPDGVIVVNITNRYINLAPVMEAAARHYGMEMTRVITEQEPEKLLYHTDFVMLSRNQEFVKANSPVLIDYYLQPDIEVPMWTDKFSNLFGVLKW